MYLIHYAFLQSASYHTSTESSNWSNAIGTIGQFFFYALVFAFVALLAYYSTKLIASSKFTKRGSANLQVIESIMVGYQSNIQLIKVGEKYVLVGVTKEHINFLAEVSKDDITFDDAGHAKDIVPFEKYFNQFFQKNKEQ